MKLVILFVLSTINLFSINFSLRDYLLKVELDFSKRFEIIYSDNCKTEKASLDSLKIKILKEKQNSAIKSILNNEKYEIELNDILNNFPNRDFEILFFISNNFLHDEILADAIYVIVYSKQYMYILYKSHKDSFKTKTISINHYDTINGFIDSLNYNLNLDYDFGSNFFVFKTNNNLDILKSSIIINYSIYGYCSNDKIKIIDKFYKFLLSETDEMRCK